MKYKAILFDLDDTLWDCDANVLDSFKEVFKEFNLENYFNSFEHFYELYQPFNQECWHAYSRGEIDKDTLNHRRFNHPFREVGLNDELFVTHFMETYFKLVPTKPKLVSGALEVLEYLYPKYPLYIVSNGFTEMQYLKMKSGGIEKYFSGVFLSDEIGVNKPDKRIFEHVLREIHMSPSEVVMVGDNYNTDIIGAMNAGIDQIYLSYNEVDESSGKKSTYFLVKLKDIVNII